MIYVICKTEKGNRPCHRNFIYIILPTIMVKEPKKKITKTSYWNKIKKENKQYCANVKHDQVTSW